MRRELNVLVLISALGCGEGPRRPPLGGSGGGGAGEGGSPGSGGSSGAGGSMGGSGGAVGGRGGSGGSGGVAGSGGSPPLDAGAPDTRGADASPGQDAGSASTFSFFVTSLKALQMLSGSPMGFGGNLKLDQADGLAGADEICRRTAEMGMAGAGQKRWRAYLSATTGGANGGPVHARDRIGPGPWYDRNGRLLARTLADLFAGARPTGDAMLVNDMTNERGEPNHSVGPAGFVAGMRFDNHDTMTGSDTMGRLRATGAADTCNDWTSVAGGRPYCGHSWPRSASSGLHWSSDHAIPGCAPGLDRTLGGPGTGNCVGCSGGYGGFYCFAVP